MWAFGFFFAILHKKNEFDQGKNAAIDTERLEKTGKN